VACLALASGAWTLGATAVAVPPASAAQYHPSAVRGQPIELEVQIPGVEHVRFQIDGMLENLFDHEAPFNFELPTADLEKGKHSWSAVAYDDQCCVYGSTAGSIQIYPLPKVRAPVVAPRLSSGGARLTGLVLSKVGRGLAVRAWASRPGSARSTSLPLRLQHRHRSRRVYEFARGLAVTAGRGAEIEVEVAPAKRSTRHGVEVRGRLAKLRLWRTRAGATRALQSAVTACTTAERSGEGGAQQLPKRRGCATAPATTPAVSIVCIKSMQCRPGTPPGGSGNSAAVTNASFRQNASPYHPSAVKGQTIVLVIPAPEEFPEMTLKMQARPSMLSFQPFLFTLFTYDLRPARYKWHSLAHQRQCCKSQSNGGSIRIYPLPKVRAPKVSALVLAGTAHVVGLVVSKVARNRVVRAWSVSEPKSEGEVFSIPLKLKRRHRSKRIYRFAHGFTVKARKKTQVYVEVAPAKRTLRHGVEVRGRLARIVLRRNRRTGETRAHRVAKTPCTTIRVRKREGSTMAPGFQSCALAPPEPAVRIVCVKLSPCVSAADRPPEGG